MKCPNCQVMLISADRQGVEIDYCPKCWGIWLDRGELNAIVARALVDLPAPPAEPARGAS